jgi:predicted metalloprotease with PDZ domain
MLMRTKKLTLLVFVFLLAANYLQAQTFYNYSLDLNKIKDDKLSVTLVTPAVKETTVTFFMPKIVPGTYRNSDFGKFVSNLKAYNKKGQPLTVKKTTENSWNIEKANTLNKIVYDVEDTWDSAIKHEVYSMAGTNFEADKNFVLNTCGIFGYLENKKDLPFTLNINKPKGFYGSTGLISSKSTETSDVYQCNNADHLYDSPIMFSLPDTTSIKVGNASVLISVYSPNKLAKSAFIAKHLETLLQATNKHLGGKLPVNKYAFIYYFNGEQAPFKTSGAWEHSYSSFYSLKEEPQDSAITAWVDMSAHEFFHIVTPLTISSKEVKQFDFNQPKMSRHLWLYEGSTEYDSHLVQVRAGITTPEVFLEKLSQQLNYSKNYFNDRLRFTELSTESAGKWQDQYSNVYLKGSLISASLDLYLLKLSGGLYGLSHLKHDLGVKFGKDKYFNDNELFDIIIALTYPEVRKFFTDYVEGEKPIPYEQFFGYAGVTINPAATNDKSKSAQFVLNSNATSEQIDLRNIWLNKPCNQQFSNK